MKYLTLTVFAFALSFNTLAFANTVVSSKPPYENIEWLNLLHYSNGKSLINSTSDFFLSNDGYKNPESEYKKFKKLLQTEHKYNDESIQCRFPARTQFVLQHEKKLQILKQKCSKFDEFDKKVPIDYLEVGFASENNKSPVSMMGHSFLILSGKSNNVNKNHVFAYSANLTDVSFVELITNGLFLGLDGAYTLKPYKNYHNKYVVQEQRSIWKFKINLNKQQIKKLKLHLWELRQHNIHYSLMFHNCNTATISLLKVADKDFDLESYGLIITPVEYLQQLSNKQKITDVALDPSDNMKQIIKKHKLNYVLDANKPSKFSMEYTYNKNSSGISFEFSPIYQDSRDVTNVYFDLIESKMLNIRANYYFNKGFVFDSIDIIKMRSITDFILTKNLSKHIKLSFENKPLNDKTSLYPNMEIGLGTGVQVSLFKLYVLPIVGYKYQHNNILYMSPELGLIAQLADKGKIMLKYTPIYNCIGDSDNYSAVSGYIGFKILQDYEFNTELTYYPKMDNNYSILIGFSRYF